MASAGLGLDGRAALLRRHGVRADDRLGEGDEAEVYGDPRMDAACSLIFLTGLDGITARDREIVRRHLRDRGLGDEDLALYRLFHAFRFLDTRREGLFRWCVETLRAAC